MFHRMLGRFVKTSRLPLFLNKKWPSGDVSSIPTHSQPPPPSIHCYSVEINPRSFKSIHVARSMQRLVQLRTYQKVTMWLNYFLIRISPIATRSIHSRSIYMHVSMCNIYNWRKLFSYYEPGVEIFRHLQIFNFHHHRRCWWHLVDVIYTCRVSLSYL